MHCFTVLLVLAVVTFATAFAPVPTPIRQSVAVNAYFPPQFGTEAAYKAFQKKESAKKAALKAKNKSKQGVFEDITDFIKERDAKLDPTKSVTAQGHRFVKYKPKKEGEKYY